MVNNYVKLNLIPAPHKKQYNRVHLAYLVAITHSQAGCDNQGGPVTIFVPGSSERHAQRV